MTTDHARTLDGTKLAAAVMVGGMVLVGWAFDIAVLKSISSARMKANIAVLFHLDRDRAVDCHPARNPHSAALIFLFRFAQFFALSVASRGIAVLWIVASGYPLHKSR